MSMFPRLLALLVIGSVGTTSVIGSTPNFLSSGAEEHQCLNSPPVCHTLQQVEKNLRFDNGVSAIIRNKPKLESMIDGHHGFSENLPRDAALAVKNMEDASTTAAERKQAARGFFLTGVPKAFGATPADPAWLDFAGSDWNEETLAKTLGVNEETGFEGALRALGSKNSEQGKEVIRALAAFLAFGHKCDVVADVVFDELLRSQKDHLSSIIIARGKAASEHNQDASYRYWVGGEREKQSLGKFLLSGDEPASLVEKELESRKVPYVVRVGLSLGSHGGASHHFVLVRDFVEADGYHVGNGGYIVHAGGFRRPSGSGGPLTFALGADFGRNGGGSGPLSEEEMEDLIGKLLTVSRPVKRGQEGFWDKVTPVEAKEQWYNVVDLLAAPISGFGEMGGAGKKHLPAKNTALHCMGGADCLPLFKRFLSSIF